MYFCTYEVLFKHIETKGVEELKVAEDDSREIDVRCFAVFIACQLLNNTSKYSTDIKSAYSTNAWPTAKEEK